MNIYSKIILPNPEFYIAKLEKNKAYPYLIFVHGGPGFNCNVLEHLIEHENLFEKLNYNIIVYDQRGCGQSQHMHNTEVTHTDNINDLNEIYNHLTNVVKIKIKGLIGHSYGAKLVFDFHKKFKLNIPSVFVSTANSVLTPRLNNLSLDLAYLKKTDIQKYQNTISKMDHVNIKSLWEITEELTPLFEKNPDRAYLYWANLTAFEKTKKIKTEINKDVFVSVRKDLYSHEDNFGVDIDTLHIDYLWINGLHDFIMNGLSDAFLAPQKNKKTFYKSAHFPHIEENDLFCETVNIFFDHIK